MELIPLRLPGTYAVKLQPHRDGRGYFMRTFDSALFAKHGLQTEWVQENQSLSIAKHTVRGLHFQKSPHAETKLVRVLQGAVLDVFLDLRKASPAYRQWDAIQLTEDNDTAVYIPRGFAHGFCSLENNSILAYKVDSEYAADWEGGVRWNDPVLAIPWPTDNPTISEKDSRLPLLEQMESPF